MSSTDPSRVVGQLGWFLLFLGANTLGGRTVVEGTDSVSNQYTESSVGAFMSKLLILISYEQKTHTLEMSDVVKTVLARAI